MKLLRECLFYIITVATVLLLFALLFHPVPARSDTEAQSFESQIADTSFLQYQPFAVEQTMAPLRVCESQGNDNAINPHDPVTPSHGRYQWKTSSAYYYNNIYHIIPGAEMADIQNVIMDTWFQDALTKKVLEHDAWTNWTNCLRKYYTT